MKRTTSRLLAGAAACAALAFGSLVGAAAASASTISGAIGSVQVEQESARSGAHVQIDLDWRVPDHSQAGDTFTLQLPNELATFTTAFPLVDVDGAVVAQATVSPDGLTTFTLTDYVTSHPLDVHGAAHYWATFQSDEADGTDVPLTFTGEGGTTYGDAITVEGTPGIDRTFPTKYGTWTNPDDQGVTSPTGALSWSLASPRGPFDTLTIDDPAGPGQEIDCASPVTVDHTFTTDANGFLTGLVPAEAADYTIECTPQHVRVTMTRPVAENEIVRVKFRNTVTDPSLDVYRNTAQVTADGTTQNAPGSVARMRSTGEGTGTGVGPLAITKVVAGDGTPTGPFTVVVDCQWAGRQAPGYPQTLTFTGSETQTLTAPVSSTCTATETETGGATTVEVTPATTVTAATTGTAQITVTNTFTTTPPDEPNEPNEPEQPATPDEPGTPGAPGKAPGAGTGTLATTGAEVPLWQVGAGLLLAITGAGLATASAVRRRRGRAGTE